MTYDQVIRGAARDGVLLQLLDEERVRVVGKRECVERWLPLLRAHKPQLLLELRSWAQTDALLERMRQQKQKI